MKNKIIFTIFVLLVCVGLGFYFYKELRINVVKDTNIAIGEKQLDEIESNNNLGYKIKTLPAETEKKSMPDLNRKVNFSTANTSAKTKIVEISETLKIDTENVSLWIDLGSWRKAINDYEGAIEAWEYAGVIRPQSSIPFNNLGDLYAYYLKDVPRAEEYFLRVINNDPNNIYSYFKIVEFYQDFTKDTAKARAILEKGIVANPPSTSSDLKSLLKSLQ